MKVICNRIAVLIAALLLVCSSWAQRPAEKHEQTNDSNNVKTISSITIAISDFESKAPGNPELGRQISDIVTARLSIFNQFKLVERSELDEVLKEHELNLSGMADTGQATKVGKLLGARIMVFGKAFPVDEDLYIVAKIVGTETSQVKGVIAKGKLEGELSTIIDELVENLAEGLEKWAPQLLPRDAKFENKTSLLKERLAHTKLPTIAVLIPEVHINRTVVDPAAETEIKQVFKEVGFRVIECKREVLEKWTKDIHLAGADIVITGEGFSEFAARIGGLTSCIGRLEVQATHKATRKIIASERTTRRMVDLSECIAGKSALQAAGCELAFKLVEDIADYIAER